MDWLRRLSDPLIGVLFGVVVILFVVGVVERHNRIADTHRQVCAIREYIEGMYLITASSGTQPKDVLMARRAVIQRFESRMDGNCQP